MSQVSWGFDTLRHQLVSQRLPIELSDDTNSTFSGDLRFRAPQPPPTASGVQRASENPKQCYQGWLLGGLAWDSGSSVKELTRSPEERALAGTSEDCLCLK